MIVILSENFASTILREAEKNHCRCAVPRSDQRAIETHRARMYGCVAHDFHSAHWRARSRAPCARRDDVGRAMDVRPRARCDQRDDLATLDAPSPKTRIRTRSRGGAANEISLPSAAIAPRVDFAPRASSR
jgi:hypothetical protein